MADSSTCVAHRCSLKMLCLLEFQAHNGQVAAVLLPNSFISNRLLSNVAVQPPAKCPSMTLFAKTHENIIFLCKTEPSRRQRWAGRALLGPKTTPVVPCCALTTTLKPDRFAISRPKLHSYGVKCISYPFHCRCHAKITESFAFPL